MLVGSDDVFDAAVQRAGAVRVLTVSQLFAAAQTLTATVQRLDEIRIHKVRRKIEQKIADRSSRMDLIKNADGSVDIYMGPDAPKGKEANWIPTVPGKAWFPYFRLYSPKKAFMDRSWILPDIEKNR